MVLEEVFLCFVWNHSIHFLTLIILALNVKKTYLCCFLFEDPQRKRKRNRRTEFATQVWWGFLCCFWVLFWFGFWFEFLVLKPWTHTHTHSHSPCVTYLAGIQTQVFTLKVGVLPLWTIFSTGIHACPFYTSLSLKPFWNMVMGLSPIWNLSCFF